MSIAAREIFHILHIREWQVEAIHHVVYKQVSLIIINKQTANWESLAFQVGGFLICGLVVVVVQLIGLGSDQVGKTMVPERNVESYHIDEHKGKTRQT